MASIVPDGKGTVDVVLECCLEGVESASQARSGGAHRIELCANLAQGGVTPSAGDIEGALLAVRGSHTRVHVLIRPRPGDFVYSVLEKQVMEKDVSAAVKAGAHGVVIGVAKAAAAAAATAAAKDACSITFHRAFDCCTTDEVAAMESLVRLGVDRVLTSGRHESAWDGRAVISRLVEASGGRIGILPGAGVTHGNVKQLLLHTGAKEVHVGSACQEKVPRTALREDATVCVGLVGEGSAAAGLKRVSAGRVCEMLTIIAEGMS
ncbi:unnamed protein product [Ectocarpus sp. CCAP 1310/34]|nr:unnamed protein product [Ectocarpus sp. CCAP 1310/34]